MVCVIVESAYNNVKGIDKHVIVSGCDTKHTYLCQFNRVMAY